MGKYINCQIIQLAQRVYHGKNQHSPQLGRSIILVKPRGNFADVKASDLAGSQDMFQQRKHRFRSSPRVCVALTPGANAEENTSVQMVI